MSPLPSLALKTSIVSALSAHAELSSFSLLKPEIDEDIWRSLVNASDSDLAAFMQDGKQALSNAYFKHMRPRAISFLHGDYDTISQALFTQKMFQLLLERADWPLDETPAVSSEFFYFFVSGLEKSLSPCEFSAWFLDVFGPLIEVAETVLHESVEPELEPELEEDVSEDSRAPKRARIETEGRFSRSFTLFRRIRDLQRDIHAEQVDCDDEQGRFAIELPLAPKGIRSSKWSKAVKHLVSEARRRIRRHVAFVLDPIAAASPRRPSISALTFAPRLDPRPRVMPGAWTIPAESSARLRPTLRAVPDSVPRAIRTPASRPSSPRSSGCQDTFSRFPKRTTSSTFTVQHFCGPLADSSKS